MQITVLVGTMTGTAQLVAQEIELAFETEQLRIVSLPMDGMAADALVSGALYLVCTSTYGQGDVPDNARALFTSLETTRPDLSGVRYGVIALGDQTYADTFCFGGKRFDQLLSACGAQRIGEVMLHDASGGTLPEEVVLSWFAAWLEEVGSI